MWIFYIVIAIILLALLIAGVWYVKSKVFEGYLSKTLRNWIFLFKFFLIGKYHCHLSKTEYRLVYILHKLFWAFVCVSIGVTIGRIYEILVGY